MSHTIEETIEERELRDGEGIYRRSNRVGVVPLCAYPICVRKRGKEK